VGGIEFDAKQALALLGERARLSSIWAAVQCAVFAITLAGVLLDTERIYRRTLLLRLRSQSLKDFRKIFLFSSDQFESLLGRICAPAPSYISPLELELLLLLKIQA